MFRNALVMIGFLWFSLAPTLCAAGVLTHACDFFIIFGCESSCVDIEHDCLEHSRSHDDCTHDDCTHDDCTHDDCTHDDCSHEGCSHGDDGCSHDACAKDPCQVQVVVQKVRDEGFHSLSHDALAGPDSIIDGQLSTLRTRPYVHSDQKGAGKNLPYPPSDMPLRA